MSQSAPTDVKPENARDNAHRVTRAAAAAGAVAGALWAASGLLNWYLVFQRSTVHHEIVDAIAPATFGREAVLGPLGVVTAIVAAVFVAAFTAAFTGVAAGVLQRHRAQPADVPPRPGQPAGRLQTVLAAWLGSVLAATLAAACIAIGQSVQAIPHAFIANGAEWPWPAVVASSYWGAVAGWVPGLVAAAVVHRNPGPRSAPATADRGHLRVVRIVVGVAVASALALGATSFAAESAAWAENHAVQPGIARPSASPPAAAPPATTAAPEPTATATPVPSPEPDDARCTPENGRITVGATEAALGHRALTIYLTNTGGTTCDAFGYPSIAFRAGEGTAANVTVSPGVSYMATDPRAAKVSLAPGATAKAVLSWGAGARLGAEGSISGLSIAGVSGAPGVSFDLALDLADGGTATLTAWQPIG